MLFVPRSVTVDGGCKTLHCHDADPDAGLRFVIVRRACVELRRRAFALSLLRSHSNDAVVHNNRTAPNSTMYSTLYCSLRDVIDIPVPHKQRSSIYLCSRA